MDRYVKRQVRARDWVDTHKRRVRALRRAEEAPLKQSIAGRKREDGEGRLSRIHLALGSLAPGSCCKMKNYMALIRLHYRTSDYMRLTRAQRSKNEGRETYVI